MNSSLEPNDQLDLTKTEDGSIIAIERPADKPYDPDKDREQIRGYIALGLLALFMLIVFGSFLSLIFHWIPLNDLKEILTIIFGPLIALLSAVTGFYYGEQSKR